MTRPEIIAALQQLVEETPARIMEYTEAQLSVKPSPDKWSKKEILGHLIDSALHNWQRFAQIQFEPQPFVFQPYDQNNLVVVNGYQNQDIEQILVLWQALNRQLIHAITAIPDEKLNYLAVHARSGQQNRLLWLVEDYLAHLQHHLKQIFDNS